MRVIAGTYRSRLLTAPPGTTTRPTSDRLRESLFNILAERIPGSRFVDLYAGTGAVGIEAISRGAVHTFFAETGLPALKSLRTNLSTLNITTGFSIDERGATALLQRLLKLPPIDVLYLDPPYDDLEAYTQTLGFLGSPAHTALLAPEALILAEHATHRHGVAERYGRLTRTRLYRQGDTSVSFFAATQTEDPS